MRAAPPLLPAAASLIGGVAAGYSSLYFPFTTVSVYLVVFLLLLLCKRLPAFTLIVAVAFFAAGIAAFFFYGPGAPSPVARLTGRGPVPFTGRVVRPPEVRDGYASVYLEPYPPSGMRPGLVRLNVNGTDSGLEYGDVVTGLLSLSRPRGFLNPGTTDWGTYAALNGTDAVAHARQGTLRKTGNAAFSPLRRLYAFRRELASRAAASLDGDASAIFRAMVLGDEGGITAPMRDAFAASGTTHILSVSGSHVALLAGLVFLLVRWSFGLLPHRAYLRLSLYLDRRKVAAAAAIPASVMYCLLAGSQVATVRSVIMLTVYLLSVILDRDDDVLNALSLAALAVVLLDPSSVFDISFQLSFGCVLIMALAARALTRSPADTDSRPVKAGQLLAKAETALITSAAVIIGISPVIAGRFNSFSTTALPANLLAVPLAGFVVVPVGLLSCILHAVSPGAGLPLAWLNGALLDFFYWIVRFFAAPSWANLHPGAPGIFLTLLFYAGVAMALAWRAGRGYKGAVAISCAAAVLAFGVIPPRQDGMLKVTFLDVGEGDSALVELPGGQRMLVDGGGSPSGLDPGRAAVAPYLWNHGIHRLDVVVLTHPHADHMAGLCYVLQNFEVGSIWESGQTADTPEFRRFSSIASERHIPRHVLSGMGETKLGGAKLQVLHTASSFVDDQGKPEFARQNNRSLVLRLRYGDVSFLLAGDVEQEAEEAMLRLDPPLPLRSTILKLPHHGFKSALFRPFMDAVRPSIAVISTRATDKGGGPSPEVLSYLAGLGSRVFVTDAEGAVTVKTNGKGIWTSTFASQSFAPAADWRTEMENYKKLWDGGGRYFRHLCVVSRCASLARWTFTKRRDGSQNNVPLHPFIRTA